MIHVSLLATIALWQGGFPNIGSNPEDFLLTEKQAYLVLPPQAAGHGQTALFQWSPTGRFLLMVRATPMASPALIKGVFQGQRPPEPKWMLSSWDRTNGKTTDLGNLLDHDLFNSIKWFPGTDVGITVVDVFKPRIPGVPDSDFRTEILHFDLGRGVVRPFPVPSSGIPHFVQLKVAPRAKKILAVVTEMPPAVQPGAQRPTSRSRTFLIDATGRFSNVLHEEAGSLNEVRWAGNGDIAELRFTQRHADGSFQRRTWAYDTAKGVAIVNSESLPDAPEGPDQAGEIEVLVVPSQTQVGTVKRTYRSVWLKSLKQVEQGEYLLAARADFAMLSPQSDAVAILDQGVVTVRMLAPVSLEAFHQARAAAKRTELMNQAKQVATGLHIYAADTDDDRFPSQEEFSSGVLSPYLKYDSLLQGFVYTFKGGSINSIENPVGTMIGYVAGPGGFAVAYADGHVKWLPELPKT